MDSSLWPQRTVPKLPSGTNGCQTLKTGTLNTFYFCQKRPLCQPPPSPTPPPYSHFVRKVKLRLAYRLAFVITIINMIPNIHFKNTSHHFHWNFLLQIFMTIVSEASIHTSTYRTSRCAESEKPVPQHRGCGLSCFPGSSPRKIGHQLIYGKIMANICQIFHFISYRVSSRSQRRYHKIHVNSTVCLQQQILRNSTFEAKLRVFRWNLRGKSDEFLS